MQADESTSHSDLSAKEETSSSPRNNHGAECENAADLCETHIDGSPRKSEEENSASEPHVDSGVSALGSKALTATIDGKETCLPQENPVPTIMDERLTCVNENTDTKQVDKGEVSETGVDKSDMHRILSEMKKQVGDEEWASQGSSDEPNGFVAQPQEETEQLSPCDDKSSINDILNEEAKRLDGLMPLVDEPYDKDVDEEENERRYKSLIDLLSKSKFFTEVLLKKIEEDIDKKKARKRKAQDKQSSPLKRNKLEENQRAVCQIAAEVMKNKQNEDEEGTGAETEAEADNADKFVQEMKQPDLLSGGVLRDYQLEGFSWLKVLYENGVNGILADEMGLGKTIQVIALLCHLIEMKVRGPFLIIAPLSTLPNWALEFKRFAPKVPVVLYHASKQKRAEVRKKLTKKVSVNGSGCYPVVVTSYEVPIMDATFMGRFRWKYIIVDEGHRIKNHNTVLARVLRSFDSANRLLLTGTPLHNSLSELWSLLNFLVPEIFDNLVVFESWFRIEDLKDDAGRQKIIEEERQNKVISTMHQILSPFMLRRVKSEVTLDLPKKKEVVVYAPMSRSQFQLYTAVLSKDFSLLMRNEEEILSDVAGRRAARSCTVRKRNYKELSRREMKDFSENCKDIAKTKEKEVNVQVDKFYVRVKLQNQVPILRLIANHPYLVHYPLSEDGQTFLVNEDVIKSSGKLLVLDAMLSKLHARGHKVLLFSTFTMVLTILEDYLSMRPYRYERLDGSVDMDQRAQSIELFNSDPDLFLFLISTKAGGLGINLTGADTVIFFDSDWNPQVDLQAQDRCHRIGQKKPVVVYRLITAGTVDEKILERARAKRALEKVIIHQGASASQRTLDLGELRMLLESKDHSLVVQTKGKVLSDRELDKLLDRSDLME